jgi:hypothetical protein
VATMLLYVVDEVEAKAAQSEPEPNGGDAARGTGRRG